VAGEGSGSFDSDKTRLCPSCRMSISVLATKCRFCGETVSRPRVEDRHLTVHDLGGQEDYSHRVSGNVMDALEAFRAEEFGDQGASPISDALGESRAGGRSGGSQSLSDDTLSSGTVGLGSGFDINISSNRPGASRLKPKTRGADWKRIAAVIAGIVVLVVGGVFAIIKVRAYVAARNAPVVATYDNRALTMLEKGEAFAALREAVTALAHVDNDENRAIADKVRGEIAKNVRQALNAQPWGIENIDKALRLAEEAAVIDSRSETIQRLKADIEEESYAYRKMTVGKLDPDANTVVFKLIYPENPFDVREVTAKVTPEGVDTPAPGDLVRDRFIVRKVTRDYVSLEDTKRQSRLNQNRTIKLYVDGTVRTMP